MASSPATPSSWTRIPRPRSPSPPCPPPLWVPTQHLREGETRAPPPPRPYLHPLAPGLQQQHHAGVGLGERVAVQQVPAAEPELHLGGAGRGQHSGGRRRPALRARAHAPGAALGDPRGRCPVRTAAASGTRAGPGVAALPRAAATRGSRGRRHAGTAEGWPGRGDRGGDGGRGEAGEGAGRGGRAGEGRGPGGARAGSGLRGAGAGSRSGFAPRGCPALAGLQVPPPPEAGAERLGAGPGRPSGAVRALPALWAASAPRPGCPRAGEWRCRAARPFGDLRTPQFSTKSPCASPILLEPVSRGRLVTQQAFHRHLLRARLPSAGWG